MVDPNHHEYRQEAVQTVLQINLIYLVPDFKLKPSCCRTRVNSIYHTFDKKPGKTAGCADGVSLVMDGLSLVPLEFDPVSPHNAVQKHGS
jgi:hypothetical protein